MTPDRIAAMQSRYDEVARRHHVHRRPSPIEFEIEHHEREAILAANNLRVWQNDSTVPEEKVNGQRRRLAETLMITGDIDGAIDFAPDDETRARAVALKAAIEREDSESCACEPSEVKGSTISVHAPAFHIRSQKHSQIMPVRKCSKCGDLNVSHAKPHPQITDADEARMGFLPQSERARFVAMRRK